MGQIRADGDRAAAGNRSSRPPEIVLDEWVARLQSRQGGSRRPAQLVVSREVGGPRSVTEPPKSPVPQLAKVREALSTVKARGSTFVFGDAVGGSVVLGRSGDRIAHPGTVAVRGPYGLTLGALRKHALSEPQARAFEFVAAWFGCPFDALTVDRKSGGKSLSWGFWPLPAPDVGRALALWKQRAPSSYGQMLEAYGLDVALPADELSVPEIVLVDPLKGTVSKGDRALDAIARDGRRLALLARAGRHDDAKAAQLEVALRPVLPLFRTSLSCEGQRVPLASVAAHARSAAALIVALRALDLTHLSEILGRIALPGGGGEGAEALVLESVLSSLGGISPSMISTALGMRRTLSSPELDA